MYYLCKYPVWLYSIVSLSPRWSSAFTLEYYQRLFVLEFDSHHDPLMRFDHVYLQKCKKKRDQLLRTPSSVGRYNSTRVDEGRKC